MVFSGIYYHIVVAGRLFIYFTVSCVIPNELVMVRVLPVLYVEIPDMYLSPWLNFVVYWYVRHYDSLIDHEVYIDP